MAKKQAGESAHIIGYKGFDRDFKCRDFQYEVDKEYIHAGTLEICSQGFHFCELPLDVFNYYPLKNGNQYAVIEATGKVKTDKEKSATDKIFIKTKIDIAGMVKASVEIIWNKASKRGLFKKSHATSGNYAHSATSGNDAHSATSGNYAHSATSGERANSATSGYGAHSATSGTDNIACAVGRKASAKASLGCWIVVAEWQEGKEYTDAKPLCVLSAIVDGKKIKEDTFYKVEGGKFIEVIEE